MSAIKYLLDENVNPRLRKALQRQAPDLVVWCVGDAGAPGLHSSDPDILAWCETYGFSLVTHNRASMSVHLQEHLATKRHVPGIFILNPHMTMGDTVEELALIAAVAEPEEFFDQVIFLPVSR